MKNQSSSYVLILLGLAGYALSAAPQAQRRGEGMLAFILLVIAVLFWKAIQKQSS
jgi:hypothetical protein